ncbi:MAG TPA: acyl-phosphate glycerol 3-phosphate acyltransferase [Clostridiales bacterium]|nr:acyl-phosphate glycerol 3-phosphate acyltransferase [Clostridiales bacterium]
MRYILCFLIGYVLGTVNYAYIIGRIKGFDIRTKGSTNAGASNATVTMGWKIGVIVGLCDILKAFVSVIIAKFIFPELEFAGVIAGVSCILGHIFPFYLNFRGGKGFASYLGMILALDWRFFLIIGVSIIIITVVTDYIALATLTTVVVYPLYLIFTRIEIIVLLIVTVASIVMIFKHISNIKKIISGQEIGLRSSKAK